MRRRGREEGEGITRPPPPTRRSRSRRQEGQPAREGIVEEAQEPKGVEEGKEEDRETPRGGPVEVTCMGGDATPPEENSDLPGFHPEYSHLLLQGVYGDFPYHNDKSHLDGGIADDAAWQRRWRRMLRNQRAGTPHPLERWGAASRQSLRRNGGG